MRLRLGTICGVILFVCLAIVATRRVHRGFVPRGAEYLPYVEYSVDAGTIDSPNGTVYHVRFNDAGGMHSGNHWTWVVKYDLLTGYRVESAGYLDLDQAKSISELDIKWNDEHPVVPFRAGRYK